MVYLVLRLLKLLHINGHVISKYPCKGCQGVGEKKGYLKDISGYLKQDFLVIEVYKAVVLP